MSKHAATTYARWNTPRPATASEKTGSLRRGLLWTYGVINACFLAWVVGIYVAAADSENGDPFNDLGVALARELALHQAYQYWILAALGFGAGFAALYYALKARWKS